MKILIRIIAVLLGSVVLAGCTAQLPPDINMMMDNLRKNFPAFVYLMRGVSFLMGCVFVYIAVLKLRTYGEVRTMMPGNTDFFGPMSQFLVGIILIFLPTFINISTTSLWGTDNPAKYPGASSNWQSIENTAYDVITIFGYVALIRGLILMSRAAQKSSHPGSFSKGVTHLVGGILAINIRATINIILASFGYTT